MITSPFFFLACQPGAEKILKHELVAEAILADQNDEQDAPQTAGFRLAFSRPGFVTIKSELPVGCWSSVVPRSVFARAVGHAFGSVLANEPQNAVNEVLEAWDAEPWNQIHIWRRDTQLPGTNGFEPGRPEAVFPIVELFQNSLKDRGDDRWESVNRPGNQGDRVLDVILVDDDRWWIGTHSVTQIEDGWPGGAFPVVEPADMVSRAYLKFAEAVQWSGLPMKAGDTVVEIGSSPGGACQYLLDAGLKVTGVDPAAMDARILAHPDFTHIRKRSLQVKRKIFESFRWLVCDANVTPQYVLDTVAGIVDHAQLLEGLVLTMKLSDWSKATEVSKHLDVVRSWGFADVKARQLAHNRREYCLVAKKA